MSNFNRKQGYSNNNETAQIPPFTISEKYQSFSYSNLSKIERALYDLSLKEQEEKIPDLLIELIQKQSPLGKQMFDLAQEAAQKYHQLLEAYVAVSKKLKVPTLTQDQAGYFKRIGITHFELIELAKLNQNTDFAQIAQLMKGKSVAEWQKLYQQSLDSKDSQDEILQKIKNLPPLACQIWIQRVLPNLRYILMEVETALDLLSNLKLMTAGMDLDLRIKSEIRQRLNRLENPPFPYLLNKGETLNPLSHLVALKKKDQPLVYFRRNMYFLYLLCYLVNEITDCAHALVKSPDNFLNQIQDYLQKKFGWKLNEEVIAQLQSREQPSWTSGLFAYGPVASNKSNFKKDKDIMQQLSSKIPTAPKGIMRNSSFSDQLMLPYPNQLLNTIDGADFCEIEHQNKNNPYSQLIQKFRFPEVAGPSGTLDYSLVMLQLIDLANTKEQIDLILCNYVAFICPKDHSLIEVIASLYSFGVEEPISPEVYRLFPLEIQENFEKKHKTIKVK